MIAEVVVVVEVTASVEMPVGDLVRNFIIHFNQGCLFF